MLILMAMVAIMAQACSSKLCPAYQQNKGTKYQ